MFSFFPVFSWLAFLFILFFLLLSILFIFLFFLKVLYIRGRSKVTRVTAGRDTKVFEFVQLMLRPWKSQPYVSYFSELLNYLLKFWFFYFEIISTFSVFLSFKMFWILKLFSVVCRVFDCFSLFFNCFFRVLIFFHFFTSGFFSFFYFLGLLFFPFCWESHSWGPLFERCTTESQMTTLMTTSWTCTLFTSCGVGGLVVGRVAARVLPGVSRASLCKHPLLFWSLWSGRSSEPRSELNESTRLSNDRGVSCACRRACDRYSTIVVTDASWSWRHSKVQKSSCLRCCLPLSFLTRVVCFFFSFSFFIFACLEFAIFFCDFWVAR